MLTMVCMYVCICIGAEGRAKRVLHRDIPEHRIFRTLIPTPIQWALYLLSSPRDGLLCESIYI